MQPGMTVTVVATSPAPILVSARVTRVDGPEVELLLDRDADVGSRVILELPAGSPEPRATASVVGAAGRAVRVRVQRTVQKDAREYPRLVGRIGLRYRRGGDAAAWMGGADVPGDEREPDPFMNFSVTGLAFEDEPAVSAGDTLLASLTVPGAAPFRATARVVRTWPIPEDEREEGPATHRIAIVFDAVPPEGTAALLAYTQRLQELLTEG